MNAALRTPVALAILVVAVLVLLVSTVVIVPETKQVVILRFQQPIATVNAYRAGEEFGRTGAGATLRIPFVDNVVWVDKRILAVDLQNQPVLSTDQLRLEVDAYARFRIVDPLRMVVTVGSERNVTEKLEPLFSSALRNELGKRPFGALLSPERTEVMDNIQVGLQRLASKYGVQIVDVRIKHADLPTGAPLDSAYQQMRTARQQEAQTIQAQGQRDAQIIRATAQAEAAQIYARSFNKDPKFYAFYRAMQSYRVTFLSPGTEKTQTQIILSPNNSYLREFMGQR
ncbi:MAG: protease modulator HflC [Sphingomonas sp.]